MAKEQVSTLSMNQIINTVGQALEKDMLLLVISVSALVGILILVFMVLREFFLWYFKTRSLIKEIKKLQSEVGQLRRDFLLFQASEVAEKEVSSLKSSLFSLPQDPPSPENQSSNFPIQRQ